MELGLGSVQLLGNQGVALEGGEVLEWETKQLLHSDIKRKLS